jgi:hypothetical protein
MAISRTKIIQNPFEDDEPISTKAPRKKTIKKTDQPVVAQTATGFEVQEQVPSINTNLLSILAVPSFANEIGNYSLSLENFTLDGKPYISRNKSITMRDLLTKIALGEDFMYNPTKLFKEKQSTFSAEKTDYIKKNPNFDYATLMIIVSCLNNTDLKLKNDNLTIEVPIIAQIDITSGDYLQNLEIFNQNIRKSCPNLSNFVQHGVEGCSLQELATLIKKNNLEINDTTT